MFVNAVGAQDELIFNGRSVVLDEEGRIVAGGPAFEEALLVVDVDAATAVSRRLRDARRRALARARRELPIRRSSRCPEHAADGTIEAVLAPTLDELEQMRRALELGLGDYVAKNGFHDVVLGISGGIDSALAAALAAETLGPERVHCVSMPSRYSSDETQTDAKRVAESIDADYIEIPIEPIVGSANAASHPRSRAPRPESPRRTSRPASAASLVMALSNKFGWLALATGSKSELTVGYATLYGDMAGGFALLKDVYRRTCSAGRAPNEHAGREIIPQSVIDRAPSAELRPDQRDEDSLPPLRARPGARSLRRAGLVSRGARYRRVRPGRRRARRRADRPRRVQAPPGASGCEAPPEGVRP